MKIAYILPRLENKSSITIFQDLIPIIKSSYENIEIDIYFFDECVDLIFTEKTRKISFFDSLPINDYDIIHSSGIRPNLYIYLNKRKFNKNTKLITTIHSFIFNDFKNQFNYIFALIFTKLWLFVLNSQDVVVVLTEIAKEYYSQKLKTRIEVVNNGRKKLPFDPINESDEQLMLKIRGEYSMVLGTHAVVSKIKGLDTVIKGLQKLKEFCFIIIGDGPDVNRLKMLAKQLNVQDQVFFLGHRKNIGSFFKFYNVYVMPSKSEGLPVALVEAVSFKTPCLTSDIPTFKELFSNKEVPCFILDDVNDFCKEIIKFKDINYCENLVEKAYVKYTERYTDNIMAINYFKLYKNILND
jgi:glycosyltransferase involved in cell wall biosynthesis